MKLKKWSFAAGILSAALLMACGQTESAAEAPAETVAETESAAETETEAAVEETAEAEPKELDHINMAYNPSTGNILGFIAIDSGIAEEEGLEIELIPFSNSTDALNALQVGKVDVGVSFGTIAPLTFVTQGADFTIFGGYVSGGMPVYGDPSIEYEGLETFVGKTVAVARMYTPDLVWRGAMMKAGYDLSEDVNIIEFKKPAEVLEAVSSGKADIGIGTNSTYLQALAAGLNILTWSNDLDPMHVCCRPVANTEWTNNNPDMIKRLLRAWIRTEEILINDPEYCVKLNMEYMELDEEQSREMLLETNQIFESDPKSNGVRYMWELMGELDYADTEGINVEDHINAKLYKEALDELIAEDPDNETLQMFAERYESYNN